MAVLVLAGIGSGVTIRVPSQQPTIQAGLNAAATNDTVLVAPGTYHERIVWPGIDGIVLLSEAGRASTVIDGDSAGSCITMSSAGITRATVIKGFTLANGNGAALGGGGICVSSGAPSIIDNRITGCTSISSKYGAGLRLTGTTATFNPLVMGNEIDGNATRDLNSFAYGGGIYLSSSNASARPEICYNYIHDDTIRGSRSHGGGIWAQGGVLIYGNVITDNVATGDGYTRGGGMNVQAGAVVFSNLIANNRSHPTSNFAYGAGLYLNSGTVLVFNNTIAGNVSVATNFSYGGGIDNRANATLQNNIIADNVANTGSGIYRNGGTIDLSHNDYWNNTLSGCTPGTGDIQQDPLFVAGPQGAYYLSHVAAGQPQTSPCVDAGAALPVLPLRLDTLLARWTTRTDSVPDAGVPDMGYHYPRPVQVGIQTPEMRPPAGRVSLSLAPNPVARGFATLRFSLPKDGPVTVAVFDIAGRAMLRQPAICNLQSAMTLDARKFAAGVYLVRLDAGGFTASEKFVVQR